MAVGPTGPNPRADDDAAERELDCLLTIGAIVGAIAHEINNPLAGIQNAFLLIKDAVPPSHPHYAYVGAIEREIRRISAVTRRLADTYNPERDRALGVAVSTIIGEAARMAAATGGPPAPPIRIASELGREPLGAPAGLLRHALHQILEAAGRTSHPDHPIEVGVRSGGGEHCVAIRRRVADAADGSIGTAHTSRMLAALGAASELRSPEEGWEEITVRIPIKTLNAESRSP